MRTAYATIQYEKGEVPEVTILDLRGGVVDVTIGNTYAQHEATFSLIFDSEQDLINFKNNVLWAYEEFVRSKGGTEG